MLENIGQQLYAEGINDGSISKNKSKFLVRFNNKGII